MSLFGIALAVLVAAATPDLSDGAAFMRDVAATYAANLKGVASFVVTTQSQGPDGTESAEAGYVIDNGQPIHKHYLKHVKNGRAAGADDLTKSSKEPEGPMSRYGMHAPYFTAAVADYTYSKPHEDGDLIIVEFTATIRDQAHGDGLLAFSRPQNRIDHIVYKPAILPRPLTAVSMEINFAPVIGERWDVVKIARSGTGKIMGISGHGTSTTLYDHYQLFPSAMAATLAVDQLTP